MKELQEEISHSIVSSGLVDEDDIEQLAKNIATDIARFTVATSYSSIEQTSSDIYALYNNGVGDNKIKELMRDLAVENMDLAKTMFKELQYWIDNEIKTES